MAKQFSANVGLENPVVKKMDPVGIGNSGNTCYIASSVQEGSDS